MPDHIALLSGAGWINRNGKKYILAKGSVNVIIARSYKKNERG